MKAYKSKGSEEVWHIYAVYDLTRNRTPLGGVPADTEEHAMSVALALHRKKPGELEVKDTGKTKLKRCCT